MKFFEKLNEYMEGMNCTAKELSNASGLSPATISRYKNGERIPEIDSEAFGQLCEGLADLSKSNVGAELSKSEIERSFYICPDIIATDKEQFRHKLNILISVLNINISKLCQYTNYETSALFRIRNGSRKASDPVKLAADISGYVSRECGEEKDRQVLSELFGCPADELSDTAVLYKMVSDWLITGQSRSKDEVTGFLEKLNEFDLNEYIKAIHFDELKVPTAPFQLPTSKAYFGLQEMMASELDFLKATVLSKSKEPVIMYSDMPMEEMSKDPEFPKKWMFGMAMMLKKGLHLNMIHNLDRPFNEMLLGLESFIPMYMTGQISPFYFDKPQNTVFLHFLKVSGTAALTGEAIAGNHESGKYYLTKSKEEVAYYQKRAQDMLTHASPLMDIYTAENEENLNAFLLMDSGTGGNRRSILSAPPLYSMERERLEHILGERTFSHAEKEKVLNYADRQKRMIEDLLASSEVEDEIPILTKEEFQRYPISISLSGIFLEKDIVYSYDEYLEHIRLTEEFENRHKNYRLKKTSAFVFRNLQIHIHEGKWAMVSKSKSPEIHFVIHHPKLCQAIEHFVPPMVE